MHAHTHAHTHTHFSLVAKTVEHGNVPFQVSCTRPLLWPLPLSNLPAFQVLGVLVSQFSAPESAHLLLPSLLQGGGGKAEVEVGKVEVGKVEEG